MSERDVREKHRPANTADVGGGAAALGRSSGSGSAHTRQGHRRSRRARHSQRSTEGDNRRRGERIAEQTNRDSWGHERQCCAGKDDEVARHQNMPGCGEVNLLRSKRFEITQCPRTRAFGKDESARGARIHPVGGAKSATEEACQEGELPHRHDAGSFFTVEHADGRRGRRRRVRGENRGTGHRESECAGDGHDARRAGTRTPCHSRSGNKDVAS